MSRRYLILLMLLFPATSLAEMPSPILNQAKLRQGSERFPRISIEENWAPTYQVKAQTLQVRGHEIIDVSSDDISQHRAAAVDPSLRLRWIGETQGIALLAVEREREDWTGKYIRHKYAQLNLATMKWLAEMTLPEPKGIDDSFGVAAEQPLEIRPQAALVLPQVMVVFSKEVISRESSFEEAIRYWLCAYRPDQSEPVWIQAFPVSEYAERYQTVDWRQHEDRIVHLTNFGATLIVCPSPLSPLILIDVETGQSYHQIPAIWEYDRAFMGPTASLYYFSRFGLDYEVDEVVDNPIVWEDEGPLSQEVLQRRIDDRLAGERRLHQGRELFYAKYEAYISAGPFLVTWPESDESRLLVAVSRSAKCDPGSYGQPEECLLYEVDLDSSLSLSSMTRLPRMVNGSPCFPMKESALLGCEMGALVRVRRYEDVVDGEGFGTALEDLALPVEWFREYIPRAPKAWHHALPKQDVFAKDRQFLFRPSIAYLIERNDRLLHLQINIVDLQSGLDQNLTLDLPLTSPLPEPTVGIKYTSPDGSASYVRTSQPFGFWIDQLEVTDNTLTVVLGSDRERNSVSFDISSLYPQKE
ncbi:hypothetical protein AB1L30_24230 [Bremerella sp. JC817]|uniref:hypothetical protein n=1 Tax=Bremerella sp. JC817 TaxID=3231756 RepID=UPI00345798F4